MAEGIEATRAVLADLKVLIPKLIQRSKDGVGVDDAIALVSDPEVRAALSNFMVNVKKVPAEERDLTLEEVVALVPDVTALVVASIAAAKAS